VSEMSRRDRRARMSESWHLFIVLCAKCPWWWIKISWRVEKMLIFLMVLSFLTLLSIVVLNFFS
jgi:hypothetical protein